MSDHDSGTPGGLADRVKGTAKSIAGSLTGNHDLQREGALHHERVDASVDAARLEATAHREKAKADIAAREARLDIESKRATAETTADAREQRIEHDRAVAEGEVGPGWKTVVRMHSVLNRPITLSIRALS